MSREEISIFPFMFRARDIPCPCSRGNARESLFCVQSQRSKIDLSMENNLRSIVGDLKETLLKILLSLSISLSLFATCHRIDSSHVTIITPRAASRRSSRSYPFAEGERQRESHASSRRMGEGRSAWAARCVARASDPLASACMRFDAEGERTRKIEYVRDLHPDAVGHLAIVIGDVPLVPKSWPLVDFGDQLIRVHLHLVPHASD